MKADRENVRLWLERDACGNEWVYVETRHHRLVIPLPEFIDRCRRRLNAERTAMIAAGPVQITRKRPQKLNNGQYIF